MLPGFRGGMRNVALDEQRHIGFGVKLLRDLAAEDPEVPLAVADLLREVLPYSAGVFVPPGWDRRYSECFGFTLEEIYEEGGRSFETKLRAAGLPVESLPGPIPYPFELPAGRARPAHDRDAAGRAHRRGRSGAPPRDPATMELLFDSLRRGVDHRHAPPGPLTLQWDFPDAEPWHLRLDNGDTSVAPGLRRRRRRHLPRALRRLRRGLRGPARPAPRDRHRAAAPARLGAGAVGDSPIVRLTVTGDSDC